jgi:hypothetical protein
MSAQDEITKAIGAHGLWKSRLSSAIESGKSEFTPDQVKADDACEFGRWLYGSSLPQTAKQGQDYETCRHLHAEFHQEAANVLKLALIGQKDKAIQALGPRSKFADISASLTGAMIKWKKAIGG